jgi:hypothetical protein
MVADVLRQAVVAVDHHQVAEDDNTITYLIPMLC